MISVTNYSEGPKGTCWVVTLDDGPRIMLDCGMTLELGKGTGDGSRGQHWQLPRFKFADLDKIDVILLSNSVNVLALPYVTELSGFRGKVYATGPTVTFGRMLMEDFVSSKMKVLRAEGEVIPCYTINDVHSCINNITPLSYDEIVSLGSHFALMDEASLRNVDIVIAADVSSRKVADSGSGSLLFPVLPFGITFEVIECIHYCLNDLGKPNAPIHYISPYGKESVHMCNILGEWMNASEQLQMFRSQMPMSLSSMVKANRLKVHASIQTVFESSPPYYILVGHPSMAYGDVCYFVDKWKSMPNAKVILTESAISRMDISTDFPRSRIVQAPMEARLSQNELVDLITNISPHWIIMPSHAIKVASSALTDLAPVWVGAGCSADLPLESTYTTISVAREVAQKATLMQKANQNFTVSGTLSLSSSGKFMPALDPGDSLSRFLKVASVQELARSLIHELKGTCRSATADEVVVEVEENVVTVRKGDISVEGYRLDSLEIIRRWIVSKYGA
ncbi:Integrator complex subunit 9 [Irineochytrium annulatum]|nr:Integrator complex subunit 9 [Irineochytrium annulatum]